MTLVIMAAGMGSRFGGLKQIEPISENGEFIIDYSIYDAIRCGFTKVVFIIKEENYDIFRETIGKRVEDKIHVEYVFQELDNLPEGFTVPENRVKPWGTGHAILCAKAYWFRLLAQSNNLYAWGCDWKWPYFWVPLQRHRSKSV